MTTKHATATHTPAPWTVCDDVAGRLIAVAAWESAAIIAHTVPGQPMDVRAANARLIAAAPEMLQALRAAEATVETVCVRFFRHTGHKDTDAEATLSDIRAAIAKATGAKP